MKKAYPIIRCGLGQTTHRFLPVDSTKPCVIGGIIFDEVSGFQADSDGDVIFHSICKAIASVTHVHVLAGIAQELFLKEGVTGSEVYVKEALKTLGSQKIMHVAISLEAKHPRFQESFLKMRERISAVLGIEIEQIGITALAGDGLTDVGCGDGVACTVILTTVED
jgi:2-C-methyl-D-erythritol 2,4-cyclodiphosphate synthase